ncbi:hypothetical protein EHH54_03125 [Rhizobium leguminosarum]|uniref:hypothetical protein n=1 Tax=Rhizobium TaxID=379 RepID=UPI000FEC8324|nr:hypothetical protein [Rhizobium leguminosarum]MDH6270173.1 hypothetical protein [Rhizobium leguminosarum]RWX42315.1 hypothetical protein EHH54_03125 [Rhizobium leguminosarum]
MNLKKLAFLLSQAALPTKCSPSIDVSEAGRPKEYIELEFAILDEAVRTAEDFPGEEWQVWSVMAEAVENMNAQLTSIAAPKLKLVPYSLFLETLGAGDISPEGFEGQTLP